ncbi:MAG: alanine dehydrogenase [Eubacteriales bacterium]|jgi:alanine dehydrogenase
MIFGLLRDIKNGEYRTIATPNEIATIVGDGHTALVQKGAGERAGFSDEAYTAAGAQLVDTMEEIYARCDFVTKVKELEPCEYGLLREGQIVFTCIHPAAHREEVQAILDSKVIAFTAEDSHRYGSPNCEAAGKQGALMGLESMLTINGGKGKFVGGLAGAPGMRVLILGAGIVGKSALQVLHALGARCTVLDINIGTLRELQFKYGGSVDTMMSTKENVARLLPTTDMVLNCVKWPKGDNSFLIDRPMLKLMEKGSVIVDISNDDNGAIESFHETTHADPRYIEEGIVHYCVSNIPGAIAHSTSVAYAASVIGHFRSILANGVAEACARDGFLRRSLTAYKGYLTHEETSALQNRPWIRPEEVLGLSGRTLDMAPPATVTRSNNFLKL